MMSTEPGGYKGGSESASAFDVLLVDDEEFVLDVQRRMLERCGYACIGVSDGPEAIYAFRSHPEIQLVILDAVLPDDSSMVILRQLKAIKPSVKVIISSGLAREGAIKALLEAGADDFLAKPYLAHELLEHLKTVLVPAGHTPD
jgi:two-component system, cell cycle sensor histidine kinase and response regulator CckA